MIDSRLLHTMVHCFLALFIFSSCYKNNTGSSSASGINIPSTGQSLNQLSIFNVPYGNDLQQQMDIYLPKGRDRFTTPMLVMVHGGQWTGGDKNDMSGYYTWLSERLPNFAFANINYRLATANGNKFPTQELDVHAAIEFLLNKTDSFNISKNFAVLGESAGGQLSTLVAFKIGKPVIKVAIGIGIPSNIEEWYRNPINATTRPLLEFITGGSMDQLPLIYQNASVHHFVSNKAPKTFLIHGKNDGVISVNQSIDLAAKINASGADASVLILDNELHNFSAAGQIRAFEGIVNFLKTPDLFR